MIAPLRPVETAPPETETQLRRARRLVARTLLGATADPHDRPPPVAAWVAWLFAGWVVLVAVLYFLAMAGWW